MRVLSAPGETEGEAVAVNDWGQVAGMYHPPGELGRAFFWQIESGMQDFGGALCAATAMNGAGQIVGGSMTPRDGSPFGRAFLWQANTNKGLQDLGDLRRGAGSIAWAINRKVQVVGLSHGFDLANDRRLPNHMFVWQADKGMQDLGVLTPEARPYAINNLGQIVGGAFEQHFSGNPPFLYSDGKTIDLNTTIDPASGWRLITPTGINDSGQIVGNGKNKAGQSHAFLLTPVPQRSSLLFWGLGAAALLAVAWRRRRWRALDRQGWAGQH
jgi:probable HAF family extracellular repeat protein